MVTPQQSDTRACLTLVISIVKMAYYAREGRGRPGADYLRESAMGPTGATGYWTALLDWVSRNLELAEPLVFGIGFAESILVLSLFVPSSFLLVVLGGLHSAAGGTFWSVWLAGAAGACLGDMATFAIGRRLKTTLPGVWPFRHYPEHYTRARQFLQDWGFLGIVGSKFLGFARPFAPAIAGAAEMRWSVFVMASALSSLVWAAVFLAPGYGISLMFG